MRDRIRGLFMQNDRICELFKRDLEQAGIEPDKYLHQSEIRYSRLDEAIADLPPEGGTIYVPPGVHKVNLPLPSGTRIVGCILDLQSDKLLLNNTEIINSTILLSGKDGLSLGEFGECENATIIDSVLREKGDE